MLRSVTALLRVKNTQTAVIHTVNTSLYNHLCWLISVVTPLCVFLSAVISKVLEYNLNAIVFVPLLSGKLTSCWRCGWDWMCSMYVCESLMVGADRAALHGNVTPQAVRVSLHWAQKWPTARLSKSLTPFPRPPLKLSAASPALHWWRHFASFVVKVAPYILSWEHPCF